MQWKMGCLSRSLCRRISVQLIYRRRRDFMVCVCVLHPATDVGSEGGQWAFCSLIPLLYGQTFNFNVFWSLFLQGKRVWNIKVPLHTGTHQTSWAGIPPPIVATPYPTGAATGCAM